MKRLIICLLILCLLDLVSAVLHRAAASTVNQEWPTVKTSTAQKLWDRLKRKVQIHPMQSDRPLKRFPVQGMPFVVSRPLGKGHFAAVYEGHLESSPSSIMVLKDFTRTDTLSKIHYENEARVLSLLGKLYLKDDQLLRIVQERIPGTSMDQLLRDPKYTSPKKIKTLKAALAKAIDDFHAKTGLLHGDIRPGNVMFAKGRAELIDFGKAETLSPGLSSSQRQTLFDEDKINGLLEFDKYLMLLKRPRPGSLDSRIPLENPFSSKNRIAR
jgi:serine/threonine protein kinase